MTEAQADNVQSQPSRGRKQHVRETRLYVYLPFALAFFFLVGLILVVAFLPQRLQVSLIADWMITLLILCPLVLCLFPLILLITAGAYGANRLHDGVAPPLERLEELTGKMNERVTTMADTTNQRIIQANARFAPILNLMHRFMGDERIQNNRETPEQPETKQ